MLSSITSGSDHGRRAVSGGWNPRLFLWRDRPRNPLNHRAPVLSGSLNYTGYRG